MERENNTMTYHIIATGSGGNAVLINDSILIDCGVPFKKLEPYIKDLRLVLLTHVHGDHFKPSTVATLHKQRPGIRFGCCEWMVGPLLEVGVDKRAIHVYGLGKTYFYSSGAITCGVKAEETLHNVRNCCYHIFMGGEKIFYATDCATLDGIKAKDYDYYLIEANHTRAEIETRIAAKHAAGEFAYEVEAARNHLSYEQAVEWLAANDSRFPNGNYEFLHQHQEKDYGLVRSTPNDGEAPEDAEAGAAAEG